MDDIVITGIGVISSCGIGREAFWESCMNGQTGIAPVRSFDTSPYRSHLGGEARNFNPKDFMPSLKYRRMSRVSRMAVAASIEALKDAGLEVSSSPAEGIGVMMGTAYGSSAQTVELFVQMLKEGAEMANPALFPDTVPNAAASQISIYHGLRGVNVTFSHNEISGEQALSCAFRFLTEDRAEVLLAGSADELSPVLFQSMAALRALSPQRGGEEGMRPYDRRRNGRVLGEGAGILVLEKRKRASARGAKIYGSLVACAATGAPVGAQAYEQGAEQMARAIRSILQAGGISPREIDYICGAANSTRELDAAEALAIGMACGPAAKSIPVTSLAGHIGAFCGSGALRAAGLLLAMRDGAIPATAGLQDPDFDLDHVMGAPRRGKIHHALLNGFSFGGGNACLLFGNEDH